MKYNLLSEAVLAKLQNAVALDNEEDAAQFLADAINTYVELGNRARGGAQFFIRSGPEEPLRRLRLPFEDQRSA